MDETVQNEDIKFLDIYSSIYSIKQDLQKIKRPTGTRENPSRTCKDLYNGHPQFTDGNKIFYCELK